MKRLAILGASGHGKVLADVAQLCDWTEIIFFDDAWPNLKENSHWSVISDSQGLIANIKYFDGVIVAIGNNIIRMNKSKDLRNIGANLVSIVHPSAIVSPFAKIGIGSFVGAGAIVQVDAIVGSYSIINTNAIVEHDCRVGDGVHISPAAVLAGGVMVGDLCWIGMNASIRQLITIGDNTIVGAGSVVVKDIDDYKIVVGNPAKPKG